MQDDHNLTYAASYWANYTCAEACLRCGENKSAASWLPPRLRQLQIKIRPERDRGGRGTFSLCVPSLFKAN